MTGVQSTQPEAAALRQHTPTPWRIYNREHSVVLIAERELELMSTSWHSSIRSRYPLKAESLANAAFVLEAVNSHAALKSRVEELTKALQFIADGYNNQDVNHLDFRVKAYEVATGALAPSLEDQK